MPPSRHFHCPILILIFHRIAHQKFDARLTQRLLHKLTTGKNMVIPSTKPYVTPVSKIRSNSVPIIHFYGRLFIFFFHSHRKAYENIQHLIAREQMAGIRIGRHFHNSCSTILHEDWLCLDTHSKGICS